MSLYDLSGARVLRETSFEVASTVVDKRDGPVFVLPLREHFPGEDDSGAGGEWYLTVDYLTWTCSPGGPNDLDQVRCVYSPEVPRRRLANFCPLREFAQAKFREFVATFVFSHSRPFRICPPGSPLPERMHFRVHPNMGKKGSGKMGLTVLKVAAADSGRREAEAEPATAAVAAALQPPSYSEATTSSASVTAFSPPPISFPKK